MILQSMFGKKLRSIPNSRINNNERENLLENKIAKISQEIAMRSEKFNELKKDCRKYDILHGIVIAPTYLIPIFLCILYVVMLVTLVALSLISGIKARSLFGSKKLLSILLYPLSRTLTYLFPSLVVTNTLEGLGIVLGNSLLALVFWFLFKCSAICLDDCNICSNLFSNIKRYFSNKKEEKNIVWQEELKKLKDFLMKKFHYTDEEFAWILDDQDIFHSENLKNIKDVGHKTDLLKVKGDYLINKLENLNKILNKILKERGKGKKILKNGNSDRELGIKINKISDNGLKVIFSFLSFREIFKIFLSCKKKENQDSFYLSIEKEIRTIFKDTENKIDMERFSKRVSAYFANRIKMQVSEKILLGKDCKVANTKTGNQPKKSIVEKPELPIYRIQSITFENFKINEGILLYVGRIRLNMRFPKYSKGKNYLDRYLNLRKLKIDFSYKEEGTIWALQVDRIANLCFGKFPKLEEIVIIGNESYYNKLSESFDVSYAYKTNKTNKSYKKDDFIETDIVFNFKKYKIRLTHFKNSKKEQKRELELLEKKCYNQENNKKKE